MVSKSFCTLNLSLNLENTSLLFETVDTFDIVIKGSITFLRALAFGNVVVILSYFIKEFARFLNIEILCEEVLLSFFSP